jgi:hypothetical protein
MMQKRFKIICMSFLLISCVKVNAATVKLNIFGKDVAVTDSQVAKLRSETEHCLNDKNSQCNNFHRYTSEVGYPIRPEYTDKYLQFAVATNMNGFGQIEEVYNELWNLKNNPARLAKFKKIVKKVKLDNDWSRRKECEEDNAKSADVRLVGQVLTVTMLGCQYTPATQLSKWVSENL